MRVPTVVRRLIILSVTTSMIVGCESTKKTTPAASTAGKTPVAPAGNPNAAYKVISKELEREPGNERLRAAQRQYGTETVERLLADLENVPETNLSVREQILVEAQEYESVHAATIAADLEALRATRQEILDAFARAANPELPIGDAMAECQPYAGYVSTDVDVREAFLKSPFVARLEDDLHDQAATGNYDDARALQQTISKSGFHDLLRERVASALHGGARAYVNLELDRRFTATAPLAGERAVWAALLGEPSPRLALDILTMGTDDPLVSAKIQDSMRSYFDSVLEIGSVDPSQLPDAAGGDVFLVVDVQRTDVLSSERTEDRPSQFVKSYAEVSNPEYDEAFKEWSFARIELDSLQEQYEQELAAFEEDVDRMYNSVSPTDFNAATLLADIAGAPPPSLEEMEPSGLRTARHPPPPPDTTRHALATRALQATPRKVREPVFQEYLYSARVIEARYDAAADIKVLDRLSTTAEREDGIAYAHERSWTQTEGVHVRDANRVSNDYTAGSIAAENEVFLEAFASICSETARKLLRAKALGLLATAMDEQRPAPLAFGLALFAATENAAQFKLTTEEIIALAETLSRTDLRSTAWRSAGLEHVIRKGRLQSTVPLETAVRLMETAPPAAESATNPGERLRRHLDS